MTFTTKGGTVGQRGVVLSNDEFCALPLRIEYYTPEGDKRIERFHPDEYDTAWIGAPE